MKKIFLLIWCLNFFNCFSQTPIEINLDPEEIEVSDLGLGDIAESIEYIPLETKDECLIGENVYFDFDETHIIIGYYNCNTLYLFDRQGHFIRTIGTKGEGPREFNGIHNIFLNSNHIVIDDASKVLIFDKEGNFIWSTSFPIDDRYVASYFNEQFLRVAESYIFRDSTYYVYDIYNQTGNLVKEAIPSVPISLKKDSQWRLSYKCKEINPVYIYQNQLHVREYLNDTVYTINGLNQFIPKYVLNLGKYKITPEMQADIKNFENHINNKVVITEIAETSNKLLMHYFYKWKFHSCYYDKKERKVYKFASDGFPNDYDGGVDFLNMYPIYGQKNNYIRTSFQAGEFIDKGEKCLSKKRPAKGPKSAVNRFKDLVMKKVDAEDNPVLMIVKLKD